jgi:cytosine/adenosine deaminase-related metal-dependent hydrolase
MKKTSFIHVRLYDGESFIPDAFVVFGDTVEAVGWMKDFVWGNDPVVDLKGQWVIPSFVIGHTHVYSLFARGLSLPFSPRCFTDILDQLWWKMDRQLDPEMIRQSGISAAAEFLLHGVTTIVDHHASGSGIRGSLRALREGLVTLGGLRAVLCFETSDRFSIVDCLAENRWILRRPADGHCAGMFGLHASMTLSEATLRAVKRTLGEAPIHIHVAEGPEDEEACLQMYGERIIPRLDRHGLLNPGSLLVHAVHCDEDELRLIRERGCTVALNVTSNLNNGVGLPDIARLVRMGIPVVIGNDGLSTSITSEWQNLYFLAHHQSGPTGFSLRDLKTMIDETGNFASSRLGVRLGRIRPGFAADLLVFPYDAPTPVNSDNIFGHLFFGLFPAFRPREVYVGGKRLVHDYQPLPALRRQAEVSSSQAQKLWDILSREESK